MTGKHTKLITRKKTQPAMISQNSFRSLDRGKQVDTCISKLVC